ncbi:hypothetical protein [Cochlodiniinecator piscidefendens]|uniref:hypothetical protein n=1 Tax=Cochlodiniinecator piscidefendens TaxID=2715756 RepID=UPI00140AB9FD|nr:hypothetical protein [Cochlodiniinecator piscidefendens]
MSGNSLEEGVMLQLKNPSHLDVGRVAVPAGVVLGLIVYIALGVFIPPLGWLPKILAGLLVGVPVSASIYRRMTEKRMKAEQARLFEERALRIEETERQLARMKANENA